MSFAMCSLFECGYIELVLKGVSKLVLPTPEVLYQRCGHIEIVKKLFLLKEIIKICQSTNKDTDQIGSEIKKQAS